MCLSVTVGLFHRRVCMTWAGSVTVHNRTTARGVGLCTVEWLLGGYVSVFLQVRGQRTVERTGLRAWAGVPMLLGWQGMPCCRGRICLCVYV